MRAAGEIDNAMAEVLKRHGLDTVAGAWAYGGGEDLTKAGLGSRRRTRLELEDAAGTTHPAYLKRYGSDGLRAAIRRRWETGQWCSQAEAEFRNVRAAREAGLTTMRELAWGAEGACCGRSYLIVTAAPGEALERCGEAFWERMTHDDAAGHALAAAMADIVREMHVRGFVHRDLYSSHVFVEDREWPMALALIDLARMFRPRLRRFRWQVKDLAELHSSVPADWTRRWWDVFLREYLFGDSSGDPDKGEIRILEHWRRPIIGKSRSITRRASRRRGVRQEETVPR